MLYISEIFILSETLFIWDKQARQRLSALSACTCRYSNHFLFLLSEKYHRIDQSSYR